MKHLKTSLLTLLLVSIAVCSFQVTAQNKAVEKMHQQYTTMINTGNAAGIDALYTQDASIRNSDGSMISGITSIKEQYATTFASGKFNISLKTNEATMLDKDHMFVSGSFVYKKTDEPKMVMVGEFVNTLKNEKGTWKIYKSYRYLTPVNNASIIDGIYQAFSKGDIPAVLGAMDPNIVWNEAEGNALAAGNPYIGPDAVLNGIFAKIPTDYDGFKLSNIKLHEMNNNQVLATLRYNATSKHNGKKMDAQAAHLWTLEDGKITAFQQYVDTKQLDEMLKK
jgi:ketosteroid isomerase-like protein